MNASLLETPTTPQVETLIKEGKLKHVAIIMDGNRRWAKENHRPSLQGHQKGVEALKQLVRYLGKIQLPALTVYAFSTENWQRSQDEVGYLMELFFKALTQELEELHQNGVRLHFIGDKESFSTKLQNKLAQAEGYTQNNTGLKLQVAVNYGSRAEITRAAQLIAEEVANGTKLPAEINEADISKYLYTESAPELDLLIRTGGEFRVSNYLLWQLAYAEFYVTPTYWPEFTPQEFDRAVLSYIQRNRRFGQ